jgi:hypothetical protein
LHPGLAPSPRGTQPLNHAIAFLFTNWAVAHILTSSHILKGYYGFDNNAAPRQDISIKAERMKADVGGCACEYFGEFSSFLWDGGNICLSFDF